MANAPKIRTLPPQEWGMYRDLRLRALADSPDAFDCTLAEERNRSDAEWLNRLASCADLRWDLPLVAELYGEPIGMAWGHIEQDNPDVASVHQMWVAPSHRGSGVGGLLLEAVIAWARARDAAYVDLEVACGDSPARRLYARAGFEPEGSPRELRPGSDLLGQPMRLKLKCDAV